jgi:hypothetical protein
MSVEAQTYVKLISPFRNTTWWVHYLLAGVANYNHGYELFWRVDQMIEEWPVLTERTLDRARAQLVEGGYLEQTGWPSPGKVARYRFVFKGCESLAIGHVSQNGTRETGSHVRQNGTRHVRQNGGRTSAKMADVEPLVLLTESKELKEEYVRSSSFDAFWLIYPRHVGKAEARKAFLRAGAPLNAIMDGAKRWRAYWDEDRTPQQFVPHPTSWLNKRRWEDEPPPPGTPRGTPRAGARDDGKGEVTRYLEAMMRGEK